MVYDTAQSACDSAKREIDKMMAEVVTVRAELSKLKTDVSGGGIKVMEEYPWKSAKYYRNYTSPDSACTELTRLFEAS